MATDIQMQTVQAALDNLNTRMLQVVGDVAEARREVKEAKDSLDEGGKYLQRDLGSNIAQFKFEAKAEFDKQTKQLNDLTDGCKVLFANNTQAINDTAAKTEASFLQNNATLERIQQE